MNITIRAIIVSLICVFTVVAQEPPPPEDPVASLRAQIAAANTGAERIRLQLRLADTLVNTGHKAEALKELDAVANSGAFDPPSFYNLGNAYARMGETDAALNAYREAIDQRKGKYSRALNNMGVILLRLGRWEEAYEAFIGALKIESFRYAEASYNLGRLYSARGQKDLAAREWRRALIVDSEHDAAKQALATINDDDRIVVAEVAPAKTSSKPTRVEAKSATVRVAKPLALDQTSYDFLQKARTANERGKLTEAVDNFQRVLGRQGGYFAPANLELSYVLLNLKRYDEAMGYLLAVSKRDGARYPISYFHLARTYEVKGDLKSAELAFVQAINAHVPTNSQFLLDLIRVREKQGDYKGALDALERYLALLQEHGQKPIWSDQRLAELRAKVVPVKN
ncbi:MAG TPA: tetratricopeptide repeat protein [Pyrinomonadaceae bacterium]|nr:tetratricopeptide repeat protein [Pyrinomonadaceae bacterium]